LFNNYTIKEELPEVKVSILKWEKVDISKEINYSFETSYFDTVLIAATNKGICWLALFY